MPCTFIYSYQRNAYILDGAASVSRARMQGAYQNHDDISHYVTVIGRCAYASEDWIHTSFQARQPVNHLARRGG